MKAQREIKARARNWRRANYIRRARRLLIVIEGLGLLVMCILVLAVCSAPTIGN